MSATIHACLPWNSHVHTYTMDRYSIDGCIGDLRWNHGEDVVLTCSADGGEQTVLVPQQIKVSNVAVVAQL